MVVGFVYYIIYNDNISMIIDVLREKETVMVIFDYGTLLMITITIALTSKHDRYHYDYY